MAFPTVKILAGKGNANQQAPGQDYISGFVFYTNSLPSGFSSSSRMKQLFSVADAEEAGITAIYSDETQATFTSALTKGATGDSITLVYNDPILGNTTLCSYTQVSGDSSNTIFAASVAAAINANTSQTGFSATASTGTLTVTVRKGLGVSPNTGTPLSATIVGSIVAGTITLGVSGVASLLAQYHYHIAEYFRANPTGTCYVGFFALPANAAAYTYSEVGTLEAYSLGTIRNYAVFAPKNYASTASDVKTFISTACGLLQTQYNNIFALKAPGQILFATDLSKLGGIANLSLDLSTLTSNRVSVIISQDGAGLGSQLFIQTTTSITDLGCALGTLSKSLVSDDIGDLSQFNLTDGYELAVPAFADGTLVKNVSQSLINQLDLYRYIFTTNYIGYNGTYYNNDHTATAYTDQFAYIHLGRTWDKASRGLYAAYLPFLKAKLALTATGTLTPQTVATLTSAGNAFLDVMVRNQELSAYQVIVPSNQNPNITGKLAITVNLVAEGIANEIDITSQFVASL